MPTLSLPAIAKLFTLYADKSLAFDAIADKRHPRPDLCAMLYLHERVGGEGRMCMAGVGEIWLDCGPKQLRKLTSDDVLYLVRCGVRFDEDAEALAMFA